jgi:hypothetical protein
VGGGANSSSKSLQWPYSLRLMAELWFPYPRDPRPPITALVMPPDQKKFYSGDAQGTVVAWSAIPPAPK